ncbi:RWD domain-containing protein 3 isoform X2 [Mugil cephalus]|uniref:RWD domain-containing protein 3 isoform X2 n=1 Tax=Mugil cephalus TaxID=48193 RepID=UPI001FB67A07|nr:RWD domain-containing protein 3 isoform X2 [Mugil cephalus]
MNDSQMSEAALEEVSILSSIYCREGEFRLIQQSGLSAVASNKSCLIELQRYPQNQWFSSWSSAYRYALQQCMVTMEDARKGEEVQKEREEETWTSVLLLDHIRSRNHYVGLLERWSLQLHLAGRLLLGQIILVILQGSRCDIKEFCRRLKTVKVDVDSSGKKCKERMMKVLIETPLSSPCQHSLQGFIVKDYQGLPELTAFFQGLHMSELYQQIMPSLTK